MRTPLNAPGIGTPPPSMASAVYVEWFRQQPGSPEPDGTVPIGRLPLVSATFTDDAAMVVQRRMTLTLRHRPADFAAGMWIRATLGIRHAQPEVYQLACLIVTSIAVDMSGSGVVVEAADPSEVLNGRPYEVDTALAGYLDSLVEDACNVSLQRPVDVIGVPTEAVPASVAEFGAGRWDVCLRAADAVGVVLHFDDIGDPIGLYRWDPAPEPVTAIDGTVLPGGDTRYERAPTDAVVLVSRGDIPGLLGRADALTVTGTAPPAWYPSHVVADRIEGSSVTIQSDADAYAANLLRARLTELQVYTGLPVLPAPWLEAGVDTVSYQGRIYWVRAMTLELPSLATTLTLRIVDPVGIPQ